MAPVTAGILMFTLITSTYTYSNTNCGSVFITVSSLRWKEGPNNRDLEMNWDTTCTYDWIGLFVSEPPLKYTDDTKPLIRIDPTDYPDGFYHTNISSGELNYPNGWNRNDENTPLEGDHCFPFWIGSYQDNVLLQADCLKIRPTWMRDHKEQMSSLSLPTMFIPGTHNSGCFKNEKSSNKRDTLARFLLTQDVDIWGQLVHGIRYLDLRVGYYPAHGKATSNSEHVSRFWVNHDLVQVSPLLPVLQDIKNFLKRSTDEVIIVDFHRFPVGFMGRAGRHRRLVALLHQELGHYAVPPSSMFFNMTLGQIWTTHRRLIISYGDSQVARDSKWLWGPITQLWGNQQSPIGLQNFLQRCVNNADDITLWAAMAELTPTPLDVMFKPSGSLREMADLINRNITRWFSNLWWQKSNIVATDFFLGNNLIDIAVAANLRKAKMNG